MMNGTPITNYINREQLENMKVKDEITFTTSAGTKFKIKKTNESERCFSFYCVTTKTAICSRCKIDYILTSIVH